jgi:hypothetical protein
LDAVNVNWTAVYNKLFKMIDGVQGARNYYSGPRFIEKIQEFKKLPGQVDLFLRACSMKTGDRIHLELRSREMASPLPWHSSARAG